jgi:hypothetical protein
MYKIGGQRLHQLAEVGCHRSTELQHVFRRCQSHHPRLPTRVIIRHQRRRRNNIILLQEL